GCDPVTLTAETGGTVVGPCTATNNANISSAPVSITVRIDKTSPTVSITFPTTGLTVNETITLTSTAANALSGVAQVQYFVDGNPVGTSSTGPSYSVLWNSTRVLAGPHVITATASDAAGNMSTSASVSISVSCQRMSAPGEYKLPADLTCGPGG